MAYPGHYGLGWDCHCALCASRKVWRDPGHRAITACSVLSYRAVNVARPRGFSGSAILRRRWLYLWLNVRRPLCISAVVAVAHIVSQGGTLWDRWERTARGWRVLEARRWFPTRNAYLAERHDVPTATCVFVQSTASHASTHELGTCMCVCVCRPCVE